MNTNEQWIKAVARLIELTQADKIIWKRIVEPSNIRKKDDEKVEVAFIASYDSYKLRLYQSEVFIKVSPPNPASIYTVSELFGKKESYWTKEVTLETIDEGAFSIYRFPRISALTDLYNTVHYKNSKIDQLLSKLINSSDSSLS